MIVKMKKATVVMYSSIKDKNLNVLKDSGLLHLQKMVGKGTQFETFVTSFGIVSQAVEILSKNIGEQEVVFVPCSMDAGIELAKHIGKTQGRLQEISEKIEQFKRDKENISFWGDYNPNEVLNFRENNLEFSIYLIPKKKFKKIPAGLNFFHVASNREKVGIALLGLKNEETKELPDFFQPVELPQLGISQIEDQISQLEQQKEILLAELDSFSRDLGALQYLKEELKDKIEFTTIESASTVEEEEELSVVQGYLPSDSCSTLVAECKKAGMGLILEDIDPEDESAPVLVKNNKFINMIKPVFDLLGTIPGYREFDISPFFLIFFTLFFAMIMGDAGYGCLLLAGSLIGAIVSLAKGKKIGIGIILLGWLSIATIIWGTITGSWFGSQELIQGTFLEKLVIPQLNAFDPRSTEFIMRFCFITAIVHLTIAHSWNFLRQIFEKPLLKAFTQLGQLSLLYGLYFVVLNLLLGDKIPSVTYYLIGFGLGAVIIFSEQEGNFFKGVLKGFANIIVIFLNIISMFSDIISYIRLSAVGLASLEIAKAFNGMAMGIMDMEPQAVGVVGGVIVIFLGHSLNLVLGGLSVVVHGVRLNMLEFSGHLGMEWTGDIYDPFRDRKTLKIRD